MDTYTPSQVAKLVGLSVRALHYYDQLGLVSPMTRGENNYRYYSPADLLRIKQVIFFRNLGFDLARIKAIMTAPNFDQARALTDQRRYLELELAKTNNQIREIDQLLGSQKGNNMTNHDITDWDSPTDDQLEKFKDEAHKRWGESEAWRQSEQRTRHWTKADYQRIAADGKKLTRQLADAMDYGATSPEFQALIVQHKAGIEVFYDCSDEMYRNLGQLYVDDPRFAAYYNNFRPGLNLVVRDAINYYCDQRAGEAV